MQLANELGTGDATWPTIAARLGTGRTPAAVHEHWNEMRRQQHGSGGVQQSSGHAVVVQKVRWTADEESRLTQLVSELGSSATAWETIAERLGTGRSTGALQQHWEIMNGKREKSGKKAAKAGRAAARGASYGYN